MRNWLVFVTNLCWVFAFSKILWYAYSEADMLVTPFILIQIGIGWYMGFLTGRYYGTQTRTKNQEAAC